MENKIDMIKQIMKKELSCSAHNIDHVLRVYNLCILIAQSEKNVDMNILLSAALLHDIARVKESEDKTGEIDHAILGSEIAEVILRDLKYSNEAIGKIKHCISTHRFRSGNEPESIEAKILFDADKLDAIGAIGIVRTFMLAGQFGQQVFSNDNEQFHVKNTSDNGRLKDMSKHSPIRQYEIKLKKIPEKLNTEKAKEIGNKRLEYMKEFFEKLQQEVDGVI